MSDAATYAAQIAALEAALGSGELTVESDGDRVTYRSVGDIQQAIATLEARKAALVNPSRRSATTVACYSPE